ncbi:uncharacterized protein LOC105787011 [Gossypium raimondii]|uniref:uncharacterized protein LOC105787011 n=1 Tax=Gossypium raimondii TaxID=29730 RepID=UPI00063A87B7|nr:uncharacterized protein LOC105787011 [Gossypium raimondii]
MLSRVLIDNGSALNVLPLPTLDRLPVDSSHMKTCQNIVRAFDGTERRVMGRIEILLIIGPTTYEVDFLVMDIKPSYNCLLGRPWIHSVGAVLSSLHQKLKLVSEGPLVTISAEEDIIATVTNNAPYVETDDEALGCSFQSLEFMNAMFIIKGDKISVPRISNTTKMGLQLMVGMRALPGRGLRRHLQGRVEAPVLKDKFDRFGLGYRTNMKQKKKEIEKRQERRMARLSGKEVKWGPMTFPHIFETFVSGGIIHPQRRIPVKESINEMLENVHIDAIHEDTNEEGTLLDICPYEPGSVLNNWTAEEIPEVFRAFSESSDINDMSGSAMDLENPFERDMCLDGSQDFGDDIDSNLSPDLLRMIEHEEKQILPYKEVVEIVTFEEGKIVKMGTCITEETKQDFIELLQEFKDVFVWSYQDMPGLNTDIVVQRLPIKDDCKPVQHKLRRMRPDVVLKIKEEVQKQFDAGFLQVVKYSKWVANIVPVPKKDGKVRMCVDYRDLNKASPEDNFPLPHVDTLVDNTARYSLFSFMDGFSRYNQIKMHPEDMTKTTFIALWGTFCYKVMLFGLKNAGATYQRAIVTLFHDMMHKEVEVYVNDMIVKSQAEKEHVQVLRKLFLRLRKFQLKLNPAKCTFGTRSGKLLRFVVSEKGIEIDPDKVKAIPELRLSHTQKKGRGFLGRLNYIARFISQLTEKCDPIFRLVKKHNPGVWDEECQHDETGRKEKAIYYLSKKFTDCEMSQKAVKGSAIADFLASRALEDYEPLDFHLPNEDLMCVATVEQGSQENHPWKLNFDRASNAVGNGIGAVPISPIGDHYPFTSKLDFDCTNNMAEYEACIMGIRGAIERKIKTLEVYGDFALVIYQLNGEWETIDLKLVRYRKLVLELTEEFDDITFHYLPRDENQMLMH